MIFEHPVTQSLWLKRFALLPKCPSFHITSYDARLSTSPNYSELLFRKHSRSPEELMPYQYKRESLNNDEANQLTNDRNTFREKFVIWPPLDTGG